LVAEKLLNKILQRKWRRLVFYNYLELFQNQWRCLVVEKALNEIFWIKNGGAWYTIKIKRDPSKINGGAWYMVKF
jgi:hypothetical protein